MKHLAAFLALSLLTGAAWAESRITAVPSTTTSLSATARLNFAVNVPRVLYLRVGDAGAINTVSFNVGLRLAGALPVSDQGQRPRFGSGHHHRDRQQQCLRRPGCGQRTTTAPPT
jgi:hypothetical protein